MVLNAGAKLGPYEIVAPLGAGGMGEVYRARDTRLGREVALKILPPAFASDPSRRARFELEARAAAALNHPNIVGIFDFGSQDGAAYIVSELVKGETLAAVIERGPVPIRKLLDIATQVADGISAAHAAKITHRDLKPANIMIAEDGRAKILDFGLARQMPSAAAAPDAKATMHHTSAGLILGTVNYMSPEQARGQEVDPRSDQFSFGLILYEMAAGKRAFERDEAVQVMSAILTDEPPPLEAKVPAPLRWSIERCLAKDPRDRYESTRDLFQELRYLRDHLSEASLAATAAVMPAASSRRGWWKLPAAFAAGVLLAAGAAIWRAGPDVPDQASYRFTPFSFEAGGQCCAYWSRDGTSVAYSARRSAQEPRQVYLRYLDSPTPLQLTRIAEDAAVAGWAADAKHVLFNRKGSNPPGIWSVASVGGEPEFAFATPDSARVDAVSPDGRAYAALRAGPDQQYGVWYAAPPGSPLKKYTPEPFAAHDIYNEPKLGFSPDGKQILLYLARGRSKEEAWLLPFPPDPSHPPRLVLQNVTPHSGTPPFCWMPDNRHVILSFAPDTGDATQLWMADTRSGALSDMTSGTESRSAPAISPDGKRLVYSSGISSTAIVSVDLATAALHPLMTTERAQLMPAWAAKAAVMAYVTDRNGPQEIWLHTAEADRPLVPGAADRWLMSPTPSPDASRVAYTVVDRVSGATRLWMISTRGGAPIQMTNDSSSGEFAGSWSPDGVWFAYLSLHRGTMDLMKVKSSGESAPVVVKPAIEPANVSSPAWSPAGDWIAYNDRGERLIAPDGSKSRDLGDHKSLAVAFSADGKTLYGIRTSPGNALLFAMDIASGNEKTIGPVGYGNEPRSFLNPGLRLSLSPDGRSVAYTTIQYKSNLWMLEGFSK